MRKYTKELRMRRKGVTKYSLMFSFLLFFFCRPLMAELVVYGEATIPLDKEGFMYVLVDIAEMRPLFPIIPARQLKTREAAIVIDNTDIALAALFSGATGRFFQLAGFGSYPSLLATVALAINRNWKYMFGGENNYWYSTTDRLSVKLSPDEVYAVGWRRTQENPVAEESGVKMPEGFVEFRHRSGEPAPLSLWLENYDSILNRMLNDEGIIVNLPIERIYLNLYLVENNLFRTDIMLQIGSFYIWEDFFMNLSSMKSDSVLETIFLAHQPILNERNLEFESRLLSDEDLVSLMALFLKNWK
jgi:hypothetical protein